MPGTQGARTTCIRHYFQSYKCGLACTPSSPYE